MSDSINQETLLQVPVVHNVVEPDEIGMSAEELQEGSDNYTSDNIKVLKGLDGVRKRPGMYLQGGTGIDGFHQLLTEIIDNVLMRVWRVMPILFLSPFTKTNPSP